MDSDAEEAVCTVKADVPLDSVLVCFAVRCLSFVSVVPHWHRRHVTVESSVRHCAAVDLERSGCEEKTWTTVRRTMISFERGHDHPELVRGPVRFEVVGD